MVESRVGVIRQEDRSAEKAKIDQHSEVVKGLEDFVETKLNLLVPVNKLWQPSELLPDFSKDGREDLQERQEQSNHISEALLFVLVGNTVTEEALPNYTNWFGRFSAAADNTGTDTHPWAQWSRGWTAEENRHGEVLTAYLRYSGRANMLAIEQTTYNLLRAGFDPQVGKDPYKALIYTSHQEQATNTSHKNVAKTAEKEGDKYLYEICGKIAGDEGRHKVFYQTVAKEMFKTDPDGSVIAMRDVYKNGISMPGALMTEDGITPSGRQSNLFEKFVNASIVTGSFTANDYVNIFKDLMELWNVEKLSVSGDASKAQDDLGRLLRIHQTLLSRQKQFQEIGDYSPWIYSKK